MQIFSGPGRLQSSRSLYNCQESAFRSPPPHQYLPVATEERQWNFIFQFHPDKLDDSLTEEDRDKAKEMFVAIDKAWKLLSDNETRENCDRQLKGTCEQY